MAGWSTARGTLAPGEIDMGTTVRTERGRGSTSSSANGTRPGVARRLTLAAVALGLVAGLGACSSSDDGGSNAKATTTTKASTYTTRPAAVRPEGPAATIDKELTAGKGPALTDLAPPDLAGHDFVEHEFQVSGTAVTYEPKGDLAKDGRWSVTEGPTADYTTRVVVRRPESAEDFNGTVVVEWLNVSGGLDANPDWGYLADELLRRGYAWAGVSVQSIGVEGGPVAVSVPVAGSLAGQGLKKMVPERYADLHHPGDGFSYDMYTQVARALRANAATTDDNAILGSLKPEILLAAGESQSGFALTSYADAVQPLTEAFDGFFIHSRGGGGLPIGTQTNSDIAGALARDAAPIRTDLDVPVLMLESESDVVGILGYHAARQDDTDQIRLWEMAGTSHVDRYLLGPIADAMDCGVAINDGPMHFIAKAGLRALDTWAKGGQAPPKAPRLDASGSGSDLAYVRDDLGIVKGGIRTPLVDVPVDVLSSEPGPKPSTVCLLMGSTTALSAAQLKDLYPTRQSYVDAYLKATDAVVAKGFVLEEDRQALLDASDPDRIPT